MPLPALAPRPTPTWASAVVAVLLLGLTAPYTEVGAMRPASISAASTLRLRRVSPALNPNPFLLYPNPLTPNLTSQAQKPVTLNRKPYTPGLKP